MSHDFILANADTDSIMICKSDEAQFSEQERKDLIDELNSLFPDEINFSDDGYFPSVVVLKAKNYVLWDGKKKKTKGSALRGSSREKALAEFIGKFSDLLLEKRFDELVPLYTSYVKEILDVKDINRWVSKKNISEKTTTSERANETKIIEALEGTEYSIGDKVYVYFTNDERLKLASNWSGDHSKEKLLHKLYNTVKIFETVIQLDQFPNYKLVRNRTLLEGMT